MTGRCRYVEGYGYYLKAHRPECTDRSCGGCVPCERDDAGNPTSHCLARKTCTGHLDHAHPITCPACIGKTREDLAAIRRAHGLMMDEALEAGVNSEAANLAGPAADPESMAWRKIARKAEIIDNTDDYDHFERVMLAEFGEDVDLHPLSTLGRWDFMLREDYGQPTTLRVTVDRTVAYLNGLLGRFAQDDQQDWPLFVTEVRDCRAHLEAVLHDSRVPEQGAPCPACPTPEPGADGRPRKNPRLVKRYADHDTTGASDSWRCPRDHSHTWGEADYRLRIGDEYLDHAPALTATQIHERYDVKPGTLRAWATRDQVAKAGKDHDGRQLYRVSDVKMMAAALPESA